MKHLVLAAIRGYQKAISRWSAPTCRYVPTCSQYGYEAVSKHGVGRGLWLTIRRIGRCHPFHVGGYDPVP